MKNEHFSYGKMIWKQFLNHRLGTVALGVAVLFFLIGTYAPFLASSKPLFVIYDREGYFPLFRYLFYTGFYTKRIDIFFNLMMFSFPLVLLLLIIIRKHFRLRRALIGVILITHLSLFLYFSYKTPGDPASEPTLARQRQEALRELRQKGESPDWNFDLRYMTPYEKLNLILRYRHRMAHNERLLTYVEEGGSTSLSTLWQLKRSREQKQIERYQEVIDGFEEGNANEALASLQYLSEKRQWVEEENKKIELEVMPLIRHFHWEDDAGGEQSMNLFLPWWELTRINRKDLVSALIFGVRISLVVGIMAVSLAMLIGIPIGAMAGYYGGKLDIFVSRLLEVWESMPTFFMLLLVVAITQSKSIFIVIAVVGIFGWTGFSRYVRGEFFKQRNLPYVEACHALGFRDSYIMFSHILPNAIPPVLTLLPFAIMGAITSEAGLSFLGLGEEGSCSWGVLMDEGRTAFPGESYLLWPPAILLTLLLIAIALVGDALRDALDPKMHR
ncbi:MAG: ABC transporter permease [Waddliaceae bacterium]